MNGRRIVVTPSAYSYPLLIKQLLHAPIAQTARQEIVYRDVRRLTYLELRDRIGRLASAVLSYSEKGVISKFAVPQKILFVEALAKTSVGKFDKKALRAQYGGGA
jgi:acyl-CoA synthetase (AMP-forming)/AMP-acid ligase II